MTRCCGTPGSDQRASGGAKKVEAMSLYKSFGKRTFDLIVASCALILLAAPILLVAILVAARLGRPVLFVQRRSGRHGRPFRIVKFRSMLDAADADGRALPDEDRLTPFGQWIRASSFDELPALWNVLKGDMSIVGPRPLHTHYDALYSPRQARRLEVRPGITGWAQVNGRNAISWPEKFALDVWYVDRQSLWLDLKIIFTTVRAVVVRDGINASDAATMPYFRGETGPEE
jgi:lipopolysaccharide/colanic/teichoic acid biosynthesis glycosyltransferase